MSSAFRRPTLAVRPAIDGLTDLEPVGIGTFRARQQATGTPVDLRVHPAPVDDEAAAVFRAECTAVAQVSSPHVALVYECGILPDGRPYRVTEPFTGSLPPTADPARSGLELARGLAAVHAAGLVHGELTPPTVGVRADGSLALLDTGTALRQDEGAPLLTSPQQLYCAPETMRDGTRTQRSDLYALGAIMHLLITGQPPFVARMGETPGEHVLRILHDPPAAIDPLAAPAVLRELVVELLSKDPEDRPSSAAAVADRLAELVPVADPPALAVEPAAASPASSLPSPLPLPSPEPASSEVGDVTDPLPVAAPATSAAAPPVRATAPPPSLLFPAPRITAWPQAVHTTESAADVVPDEPAVIPTAPDAAEPALPLAAPLALMPDDPMNDPADDPARAPAADATDAADPVDIAPATGARRHLRLVLLTSAAAAVAAAVLIVPRVGGNDDATTRDTRPSARPTTTAPAARPPFALSFGAPQDHGTYVDLRWTGDPKLQYGVVIAQAGHAAQVRLVQNRTTLRVPTVPGIGYCFAIRATNGLAAAQSQSRPIRGATCAGI